MLNRFKYDSPFSHYREWSNNFLSCSCVSLINTSVLCPPPRCGSEAVGFFLVFWSLIELNMHQHLPSPPGPVHFWCLWLFFNTFVPETVSTSLLFSSNTKCCGQQLSPKVCAAFWDGHFASGCNCGKLFPVRSCILRSFTSLWHIQNGFYWTQARLISLSCPCESGRSEAWWTSLLWFICFCIFFCIFNFFFSFYFGFFCLFFS